MSGLDTDLIQNAAELVNSTLLAKGYITQQLKFPSVDWPELAQESHGADPKQTSGLAENDRNIINILYSLCQSMDKHTEQHKALNRVVAQKNTAIEALEKRADAAEKKAADLEAKVQQHALANDVLTEQAAQSSARVKAQAHEIARLKSYGAELQAKHTVEMRRLALDIAELKDKLLDTRNLSKAVAYGRASGKARPRDESNPALVHYNVPTVNNRTPVGLATALDKEAAAAADRQYDGIATQLSELVENLIRENGKFSTFTKELTTYFERLNRDIAPGVQAPKTLPSPSDIIGGSTASQADQGSEIDPFELVSRPLLTHIYNNNHCVANLLLRHTLEKLVKQLTDENKVLYGNWQDAMAALEDWRKYRKA